MAKKNLVLRTVYLSPNVDDKLRVEAFDKRTSKNDLIRNYIELGMKASSQNAGRVLHTMPAKKPSAALRGSGASAKVKTRKKALAGVSKSKAAMA